jgi:hypothetical protein
MKLTTKTIASLLVVTSVAAAVPGLSRISIPKKRRESMFDRLLSRHDRKGEMRSEVLGISQSEFKRLSKTKTFQQIISMSGFYSERDFRIALMGYLRNELRSRGWTSARIDSYISMRSARLAAI